MPFQEPLHPGRVSRLGTTVCGPRLFELQKLRKVEGLTCGRVACQERCLSRIHPLALELLLVSDELGATGSAGGTKGRVSQSVASENGNVSSEDFACLNSYGKILALALVE